MNRIHAMALLVISTVLWLPVVEAENEHVLEIFVPALGSNAAAVVHHTFPEDPVPKNSQFYATVNTYSMDPDGTVHVESIHLHGGCSINHFHNTSVTSRDQATSILIDMNDADNCVWHLQGLVNETGLGGGARVRFQVTGNVPAYTVQEFSQDPAAGISLIFPGFAWALFLLLNLHMRNYATALFALLGAIGSVVPGWPFGFIPNMLGVIVIGLPLDYFANVPRLLGKKDIQDPETTPKDD